MSYTDVVADAPYSQVVAWAMKTGITNGKGDSTFVPDDSCTRGQIVAFLSGVWKAISGCQGNFIVKKEQHAPDKHQERVAFLFCR